MQNKHQTRRSRVVASGAAKIVGVDPETIRYYTRTGQLPSVVNASGHNEYELEDCERLRDRRLARLEKQVAKLRRSAAGGG